MVELDGIDPTRPQACKARALPTELQPPFVTALPAPRTNRLSRR